MAKVTHKVLIFFPFAEGKPIYFLCRKWCEKVIWNSDALESPQALKSFTYLALLTPYLEWQQKTSFRGKSGETKMSSS